MVITPNHKTSFYMTTYNQSSAAEHFDKKIPNNPKFYFYSTNQTSITTNTHIEFKHQIDLSSIDILVQLDASCVLQLKVD